MGHTEYLESIITEAQELLKHIASSEVAAQEANVNLSLNALHGIFTNLCDVNAGIREEIEA